MLRVAFKGKGLGAWESSSVNVCRHLHQGIPEHLRVPREHRQGARQRAGSGRHAERLTDDSCQVQGDSLGFEGAGGTFRAQGSWNWYAAGVLQTTVHADYTRPGPHRTQHLI